MNMEYATIMDYIMYFHAYKHSKSNFPMHEVLEIAVKAQQRNELTDEQSSTQGMSHTTEQYQDILHTSKMPSE